MLSDLIRFDRSNLFQVLKNSWQQAESGWNRKLEFKTDINSVNNIIISGLGGSAISGDLLKNFLGSELKTNLIINRGYGIPGFADENTLFIASSYSGNTEETISALKAAIKRKCRIIALTTGGEVSRIAAADNIDIIELQKGFQPRYALYNSFFTLLKVMQVLGYISFTDNEVHGMITMLKKMGDELSRESGTAFKTAMELKGTIPVIYSVADFNEAVGRRFKGQLNENSKMHAWAAEYPEMNHNEIVGWESFKSQEINYKIVNLYDIGMHPRVKRRFEIINNLLSKEKIDIINITGETADFRERLIECVYLCDWISYYLALLNEKDPGEIDFIHHLKDKMAEE